MKTSICVVNFNSTPLLEACLASIERNRPRDACEVIVVDNASADSAERLRDAYPGVRFIRNERNVGFAAANNQGFRDARGDFFFLLNPDTELQEGSVDALIDCLEAHPSAGMASSKLVNPDGTPQTGFMVRRLPTLAAAVVQLLLIDAVWRRNPITRKSEYLDLDYSDVRDVEQPAASAILVRRAVWSAVGGFDEAFTNWYNDVDLSARVRKGGWKILFCPASVVVHHGGMGAASLPIASGLVQYYRAMRLYFLRHHGRITYLAVTALVAVGMVARVIVAAIVPGIGRFVSSKGERGGRGVAHAFSAVFSDTIRTLFHPASI